MVSFCVDRHRFCCTKIDRYYCLVMDMGSFPDLDTDLRDRSVNLISCFNKKTQEKVRYVVIPASMG